MSTHHDGYDVAEIPLVMRPFAAVLLAALVLVASATVLAVLGAVFPVVACVTGWRVLAGRSMS